MFNESDYDIRTVEMGSGDNRLRSVNKVFKPCSYQEPVSVSLNNCVHPPPMINDQTPGVPVAFTIDRRIHDRHHIGGIYSQLKLDAWCYELSFVSDARQRQFLYEGVSQGFKIVDSNKSIPVYDCTNYNSCFTPQVNEYLTNLFIREELEGKIIPAASSPQCIHAIGAIPKRDGTYRPITDCRCPLNYSINNFMESTALPFKYNSLDDVCDRLSRGDFMCCTDIKAAYRTIPIHPDHWRYQGFRWSTGNNSKCYLDTRLSFGLRCAPYIFNEVSDFIVQCMACRGHCNVINYLDDYFCWGSTFDQCADTQNCLIGLLGQLGFAVAWPKCSSPSTKCVFLGVLIDSVNMTMSLPSEKLDLLSRELVFFHGRDRATVKQLRRLCGILAYASRVIRGGRTFSRRVIDMLKDLSPDTKRVRISHQFHMDLLWWSRWASTFNGYASMIAHNYGHGPSINTDASGKGYGLLCGKDWCAGFFDSSMRPDWTYTFGQDHLHWLNLNTGGSLSINVLELLPIWLACVLWSKHWRGYQVICWTDNTQVVSAINKGSSTSAISMSLLRHIFWYSVSYDFHLVARHIPGIENISADFLSRINERVTLSNLSRYVSCCCRRARSLG